MRLMSVALTEEAVRSRTKTVTRRLGWLHLKPGDRLSLCRKVMGRRAGEPLVRIATVEVLSIRRERLDSITPDEVRLEGLWDAAGGDGADVCAWFVTFFCNTHKGCTPTTEVTRIEWHYVGADHEAVQ